MMNDERLVTREKVFAAAEKLKPNNKRVSYRKVTNVLGGGSPEDVLVFLREWWAAQGSTTTPADATEEFPPEVETTFRDGLGKLKTAVRETLKREFDVERAAMSERVHAMTQERDLAYQDIFDSEAELQSLRVETADLAARLKEEQHRADDLSRQVVAERDQHALAEARETEVRQRVADLIADRDTTRASLEAERRAGDSLRKQIGDLRVQVECERSASLQSGEIERVLRAQVEEVLGRMRQVETKATTEQKSFRHEIEVLRREHQQAKSEAARLAGEANVLRSQAGATMTARPRFSKKKKSDGDASGVNHEEE